MENDYIPYGPEWVKEMKKMPKEIIIKLLAEANIKRKEAEKNAAAAPELLEALESIENDNGSIPQAIWDMLNAAISKATTINQP